MIDPLTLSTIVICLAGLLIGSFTDIKRREIPDLINFGLLALGFGIRIIYSITSWNIFPFLEGAAGFAVCFLIACLMFYTGQWGGGDAKLLMALGMVIGLKLDINSFLVTFIINSFIIGALWGLAWAVFKAAGKWKAFRKEFARIKKENVGKAEIVLFAVFFIMVILFFALPQFDFRILLLLLSIMPIILVYLWVFAKATENCCMVKSIAPEQLTEGDWVYKDIKYKGKIIASRKDLGIEKRQISRIIALKKKHVLSRVLVKEGVPFTPSFLFAYIATWILYYLSINNWILFYFK